MSEKKEYYYEREGVLKQNINLKDLNKYMKTLYEKYKNNSYFQGAYGKECVDAGYISGWVGIKMEEDIFLRFPGLNIANHFLFLMQIVLDKTLEQYVVVVLMTFLMFLLILFNNRLMNNSTPDLYYPLYHSLTLNFFV